MSVSKTFLQLWKQMDAGRRREAAEAFVADKDSAGERQRAAGIIAARLHLRPQKAAKLPPEKTAGYIASLDSLDEQLAAHLIRSWLFGKRLPMLTMFLDQLGIAHTNGAIADEHVPAPTEDALRTALQQLRANFDHGDVDFYLSALTISDTETWANLPAANQKEAAGS